MAERPTESAPAAAGSAGAGDRHSPVARAVWDAAASVTLVDAPPARIFRVQGPPDIALAQRFPEWTVLPLGPREWLLVAEKDGPAGGLAEVMAGLPSDGTMAADVSHGWRRLRAEGAEVGAWLQAGIALDLDAAAWPVGRAAPTAWRDVPVLLHAAAARRFDLYVPRSYARCLWEWLADTAAGVEPD